MFTTLFTYVCTKTYTLLHKYQGYSIFLNCLQKNGEKKFAIA
jgi:hypothetical protein